MRPLPPGSPTPPAPAPGADNLAAPHGPGDPRWAEVWKDANEVRERAMAEWKHQLDQWRHEWAETQKNAAEETRKLMEQLGEELRRASEAASKAQEDARKALEAWEAKRKEAEENSSGASGTPADEESPEA